MLAGPLRVIFGDASAQSLCTSCRVAVCLFVTQLVDFCLRSRRRSLSAMGPASILSRSVDYLSLAMPFESQGLVLMEPRCLFLSPVLLVLYLRRYCPTKVPFVTQSWDPFQGRRAAGCCCHYQSLTWRSSCPQQVIALQKYAFYTFFLHGLP